ncbi:MAG: hypothetical protein V1729_05535, partial [Candidatus Woesearchaeota archaeon]
MIEKRGKAKRQTTSTAARKPAKIHVKKSSQKVRKVSKSSKLISRLKHRVKTKMERKSAHPVHTKHKKSVHHKKKVVPHLQKLKEFVKMPPHEMEEEFFVPSPIHMGKYRIPLGIKFLIGYMGFLALLYVISFISGITFPTTILFGKMLIGSRALMLNSVLLVLICFMVYGFWKRYAYTFDLSIGFFSFAALNAVISLMLLDSVEHPVFRKLIMLSLVSLILMNVVIVWYVLHERKFFYAAKFHDRPVQHRDKVFLYVIVSFWIVVLLIGLTLGVKFYSDTTKMVDSIMEEIGGDYYRGIL